MTHALFILAFALAACPSHARESLFLQKQAEHNASLLTRLEALLGPDSLHGRVDKLEGRIRPLFHSLPKNEHHFLTHAAARYALHRIIVDVHGWSIEGLEPNASTFNTTSLVGSGILRGVVPEHIEGIFDESIGVDGFSLRDLAILASTVEHLVHEQQQAIVRRVCELFDIPTVGAISYADMRKLILTYEAMFLIGAGDYQYDMRTFSRAQAEHLLANAYKKYPGWEDTVLFVDDEIESLSFNTRSITNPFRQEQSSLQRALRVVEQAADHFARHMAELECQEIREDLLTYEIGESGRIRLADFYRAGLTSRFYYVEHKDYLKAIGALDDADAVWGPKVMVSNYVLAKSNCLAHGSTYSICCLNECDSLYDVLEQGTSGYESTPENIARLVGTMSSSTVQAPRNLSQALLGRLDEIAVSNNGIVWLHSRLFAQWMHQAFPRECPYPHLAGTTTSLSPMAWSEHHGKSYRIDHKLGTRLHVLNTTIDQLDRDFSSRLSESQVDGETGSADNDAELMWTIEDEVFVVPQQSLYRRIATMLSPSLRRIGLVACFAVGVGCAVSAKLSGFVSPRKSLAADSVFV